LLDGRKESITKTVAHATCMREKKTCTHCKIYRFKAFIKYARNFLQKLSLPSSISQLLKSKKKFLTSKMLREIYRLHKFIVVPSEATEKDHEMLELITNRIAVDRREGCDLDDRVYEDCCEVFGTTFDGEHTFFLCSVASDEEYYCPSSKQEH